MAFKPFNGSTVEREFVPWANEYVENNPKHCGTAWMVSDIKITNKGLIVECKDWAAFIFKSKVLYKHVLQFVEQWYKSKKPSPQLQLVLQRKEPYYVIGTDDEKQSYWSKTETESWHQCCATVGDNPELETNPLPLPDSPLVSVQEMELVELDDEGQEAASKHRRNGRKTPSRNGTTPH